MKFDVYNRFSREVQFTAEIECEESASDAIKMGLAVRWAVKAGASLAGADLADAYLDSFNFSGANLASVNLAGAYLSGANFSGAYLDGAYLDSSNLDGVRGINEFVKIIQIDTYPVAYTADVIQIGCERHTHEAWRAFDDEAILAMDGRKALRWWRKYKDWLFATIELCPARPTKTEKVEAAV